MGITAQTPPRQERQSKYDYTVDDATTALEMLNNDEHPGDDGFETAGKARSAANALVRAIEDHEPDTHEIGSRVWKQGNSKAPFRFSLKFGRRTYNKSNEEEEDV